MYATHISIPLGIAIGLLASFVQSLGLTIQRKSHVLNQFLPEHKQRVEHRRPLWILGFTIFISSNILGSLVQIASLPVVILAPLGAVSLLWNAFFARLILGDVFSPWMIVGTFLIAGGAVLIAIFGIVPEPTRSLEDLLELFRRPTFVVYFSILGAAVFVSLVITHFIDYSFSRKLAEISPAFSHSPTPCASSPTVPATNYGVPTERTPLIDRKNSPSPSCQKGPLDSVGFNRTRLLLAISYASFSGIISGMCLLFAKSGVELLLLTLRGQNQFWRWQAWVLVLGLGVFALLQLWYLHKALVLADPTLVCPSAFCFYNLSSIVNGLVYFDQFSLIPPLHLSLVVLGIFVLLGGVWVVSIQSKGELDTQSWDEDFEEERLQCEPQTMGVQSDDDHVTRDRGKARLGPVPMGRETRSEPNIDILSTSPEAIGLGLESGLQHSLHSQSSTAQTEQLTRVFSEPRGSSSSHVVPYSHRGRTSQLHKTTFDTSHNPSFSSQHTHARTPSFNPGLQNSRYTTLSPPLIPMNPVSTLGAGFQIGLSPVSPGFAIVPRERGRRLSGLGLTDADGTSSFLGQPQRRRTVSEGDARKRTLILARSQQDGLEERESEGSDESEDVNEESSEVISHGKGKSRVGKVRWKWLRNAFTRKE